MRNQPLAQQNNQVRLAGKLIGKDALRVTPSGLSVLELIANHESTQTEAQQSRQIQFEFAVKAVGDIAQQLEAYPLGSDLCFYGFFAKKTAKSNQLILHVTHVDYYDNQ